ncbi:MAG: hypothetical protein ACM30I_02930 [Gemmatimonas sp.]
MPTDASTAVRHPSPRRARADGRVVAFGLLGAPFAWALAHVVTYSVAAVVCYPGHEPRAGIGGLGWVTPPLLFVYAAGLVIAAAAGVAARRAWAASREEAHGHAGHAAEIGEGRTRFMALWGLMTSGVFFALMVFDAIALLLVPLCSH